MTLNALLEQLARAPDAVNFDDVIATINEHFTYTPTRFTNGDAINEAGKNEGSCKIFAFGKLQQLTPAQTLACFGKFYREDVLGNPGGTDHANIRNFMQHGWAGIQFAGEALVSKTSTADPENILGFMQDHIRRYLATDGEDGHLMNGFPCLVLTTVGKKSGEQRQAAVIYGKQGASHVIIASKGGSDTPPAWFVNLAASGTGHIQVKAEKIAVKMRVAEGAEREHLWKMMASIFPAYLEYQQKTARQIPVVVLDPV